MPTIGRTLPGPPARITGTVGGYKAVTSSSLNGPRRTLHFSSLMPALLFSLFLQIGSVNASTPGLGPVDATPLPPKDLDRVKVGQFAPDFALLDTKGVETRLSQFRDESTVILIFYRGHW